MEYIVIFSYFVHLCTKAFSEFNADEEAMITGEDMETTLNLVHVVFRVEFVFEKGTFDFEEDEIIRVVGVNENSIGGICNRHVCTGDTSEFVDLKTMSLNDVVFGEDFAEFAPLTKEVLVSVKFFVGSGWFFEFFEFTTSKSFFSIFFPLVTSLFG